MEAMFYGASKISKRKYLCAHCAKKDCFPNKDLKKQFKTMLQICELCKAKGRKEISRVPLHTATAEHARKTKKF